VQLSLDRGRTPEEHQELGRALLPLRDEAVLVLGSGNVVHNLQLFDFRDPTPREWAIRADEEIRAHVAARDHDALMEYPAREDAHLAVPTPEHYLPLLYAIALQQDDETAKFFNAEVQGSISMTSVLIGAPLQA
jgi:4,5-DOPA dioxygenase extradiol